MSDICMKQGTSDPYSIAVKSPIHNDEGWFAVLTWHHHDGDVDLAGSPGQSPIEALTKLEPAFNNEMKNNERR
jgi:hypothetical protein